MQRKGGKRSCLAQKKRRGWRKGREEGGLRGEGKSPSVPFSSGRRQGEEEEVRSFLLTQDLTRKGGSRGSTQKGLKHSYLQGIHQKNQFKGAVPKRKKREEARPKE